MTNPGGDGRAPVRRSRITDYAHVAVSSQQAQAPPSAPIPPSDHRAQAQALPDRDALPRPPAEPEDRRTPVGCEGSRITAEPRQRPFSEVLAVFRDTAVLVPVQDQGWLTVDLSGVRWILAFSDEPALARYALAQERGHEEWTYETVLGARLLDVAVPAAGVPCGVALDAADGAEKAVLFPPVSGIVSDAYAVDKGYAGDTVVGRVKEER
jgi:hypothetical protein